MNEFREETQEDSSIPLGLNFYAQNPFNQAKEVALVQFGPEISQEIERRENQHNFHALIGTSDIQTAFFGYILTYLAKGLYYEQITIGREGQVLDPSEQVEILEKLWERRGRKTIRRALSEVMNTELAYEIYTILMKELKSESLWYLYKRSTHRSSILFFFRNSKSKIYQRGSCKGP